MTVILIRAMNGGLAPGQWSKTSCKQNIFKARISCPNCGLTGPLLNHDVASNGSVAPSVECPNLECGFHDHIVLDQWEPRA